MNSQPILEASKLHKKFEQPSGTLTILKSVDFKIFPGEMLFVVGKSGSGKSTLLHLLGGLDREYAGKIFFEAGDLSAMDERTLAKVRNLRFGFVFQFFHLLPELTLLENVALPTLIAGRPDWKYARDVIKKVKLTARKDHYPSELSGGEKQRAAIARALVNRPSLVLCDEPTGNLDEETSESIYELIRDLNKEGQSFAVVTHDESWAWRHPLVMRLHEGVLTREALRGSSVKQAQ